MLKTILYTARILPILLIFSSPICAEDFDVDDADTLDFESFHKNKKQSTKTWKEQRKKASDSEQIPDSPMHSSASKTLPSASHTGKRFEVRERYSLSRSNNTPYSAFYVTEALHKQMAELCPKGWNKLREWSVPVEKDFYLHYELQCR
jgi:hypothetical protein